VAAQIHFEDSLHNLLYIKRYVMYLWWFLCPFVTTKTWFQCQGTWFGICVDKNGSVSVISLSIWVFPHHLFHWYIVLTTHSQYCGCVWLAVQYDSGARVA
jgi:hypothetical protein